MRDVRLHSDDGLAGPAPWVLICGGFHRRGGMDRANCALADYLLARGTPLHLVAFDVEETYLDHPGVTVHCVDRPLGAFALGERRLHRQARSVAAQLCRVRPDTRVVANGGNCAWPDVNWVHCVHHAWKCCDQGAPVWFRWKNRLIKARSRHRERNALRRARLVITNSERTRREVLHHFVLPPAAVHAVPLGADPTWRPPTPAERARARAALSVPPDVPLVAFVGALSYDNNKGLDTLLRAWQELCASPTWGPHLVVAGGGNALPAWRARVARSPIADRVHWLGFTEAVYDLLAAVDLLVSPVRYEAYGLNVQEALCRGVPAIVSASAGVAEQYPPELADWLLSDPEDVGELVRKLLLWRTHVPEWRRQGVAFSDTLRGYTWEKMAARIVGLAEEVCVAT